MEPSLKYYTILLVVCLSGAGLVLICFRLGNRPQRAIEATYLSWLVMAPLCLITVWAGPIAIVLGVLALSLVGFYEFARMTHLNQSKVITMVTFSLIILTSMTALMHDKSGQRGWLGLFQAMPAYCVAVLLVIPIVQNRCQGQLQPISLAIVGYIYIGWMLGHAAWVATSDYASSYLLFLLFSVGVTDISAFTFGRLFGRHPLRSNVSPKKTWEGSIGALCVALSLPWLLQSTFPPKTPAIVFVLIGFIIGIGAQLGDLAISAIKRDLQVKDTGDFIKGHGGLLDRIDSLIFVSPLYFHCLNYFELL